MASFVPHVTIADNNIPGFIKIQCKKVDATGSLWLLREFGDAIH
jgi:hypothetical protein